MLRAIRTGRVFGIAIFSMLGVAQFFQPVEMREKVPHPPPAWQQPGFDPKVAALLERSCADCHSNETRWPWYARISPVSWWLAKHVREGRKHLNMSEHTELTDSDRDEISSEIEFGTMPLKSYLWAHPEALITEGDRKLMNAWAAGRSAKPAAP